MPKVTVAMPVYNDAAYLNEAVDSILAQTFRDFELLIVDDGSTDGSASLIAEYRDPRIRCLTFTENRGRPVARNAALDYAEGAYLAWMDADDIALPQRLEKQVAFLDAHRDIAVCGAWIKRFHEQAGEVRFLSSPAEVQAATVFFSPLCNPCSCLRLSVAHKHNLRFDPVLRRSQDYAFWGDLILGASERASNVPEALLRYRCFDRPSTPEWHAKALAGHILPWLGLKPSSVELAIHTGFNYGDMAEHVETFGAAAMLEWLEKLDAAARNKPGFPAALLRGMHLQRQAERILAAASPGMPALRFYRQCAFSSSHSVPRLLARVAARKARHKLMRRL